MAHRTDVFVIGGGPAGLAAAIAARAKGFSVTVADGSHPPIDKACGEGLMPDTLAAVRELGVVVNASDGHVVRGVRFLGRECEATACFPGGNGIGMRRRALHEILIARARACGVSLMWNTPAIAMDGESVRTAGGVVCSKWVIGADGIGSRVRKWADLESSGRRHYRYAVRRHYRIAPWSELMEVHWGDHAQAYVTPVGAEEVCVVMLSRERGIGFDLAAGQFPKLAARLESAKLAGTERGAITTMRKLRKVYRERVALVGDASGSVDAITGEGLSLGFRQAIALADALEAGDLGQYQAAHRRLGRRAILMGRLMLQLDKHGAARERTLRAFASDGKIFSRLLAFHVGGESQAHLAATGALLGWRLVAA